MLIFFLLFLIGSKIFCDVMRYENLVVLKFCVFFFVEKMDGVDRIWLVR